MKPMLAFRYNDHKSSITYPIYVQPKYNGVRSLASGDTIQSSSRGLAEPKLYANNRLNFIRNALSQLPGGFVFDGEIYRHGWSLQKINGAAGIGRLEDNESTDQLNYVIFDAVKHDDPYAPFSKRYERLVAMQRFFSGPLKLATTVFASNEIIADRCFEQFKSEGYEGMMYKFDEPYGFAEDCGNKENRWKRMLKRKDWLDDEFEIIDIVEGEGRNENRVGAFSFQAKNGTIFHAGSGLSDAQRVEFWSSPPIGRLCKIKYEMLSDDGIPLKPTIEYVFD